MSTGGSISTPEKKQEEKTAVLLSSQIYKQLVAARASREETFINDRGSRHIKNSDDKIGVTYAFWLDRSRK